MEKMIEKMMKEINQTLSIVDEFRKNGSEKLADEYFKDFLAQAHLINKVVDGKKVEINSDGIAVLIDWKF